MMLILGDFLRWTPHVPSTSRSHKRSCYLRLSSISRRHRDTDCQSYYSVLARAKSIRPCLENVERCSAACNNPATLSMHRSPTEQDPNYIYRSFYSKAFLKDLPTNRDGGVGSSMTDCAKGPKTRCAGLVWSYQIQVTLAMIYLERLQPKL